MKNKFCNILVYFFSILFSAALHGQASKKIEWNVTTDKADVLSYNDNGSIHFRIPSGTTSQIVLSYDRSLYNAILNADTELGLDDSFKNVARQNGNKLEFQTSGQTLTITYAVPDCNNIPLGKSLTRDALYLANNSGCFERIIQKYGFSRAQVGSIPYLSNYATSAGIDVSTLSDNPVSATEFSISNNETNGLGKIGGLDVTKYADALAKFLVKRAKEELTIAFFEDLQQAIKDEPDLNDLFPATAGTLAIIGSEIYSYQKFITTLRENFKSDLNKLPDNLTEIIENHQSFFDDNPGLEPLIKNSSILTTSLRDGAHPGEVIQNLDAASFNPLDKTLSGSIQTVQLFSEGLRDTTTQENSNYWVPINKVKDLVVNKDALKIFLGLISAQAENAQIQFKNKMLHEALNELAPQFDAKYNDYKSYILRLGRDIDQLNQLIKEKKTESDQSMTLEEMNQYFGSVVEIIKSASEVNTFLPNTVTFQTKTIEKGVRTLDHLAQLMVNSYNKRYSAAVVNVLGILDVLIDFGNEDVPASVSGKWAKDNGPSVKRHLMRYATFAAALTEAENSDDMAAIIEAYALPSGSAKIKRSSSWNVALNAYLGPFVGHDLERTVQSSTGQDSVISTAGVYGLTAPVGISFSHGLKHKESGKWSAGLFISFIDIGAITTFRFKDDESDVARIFLREIFSPGAFASIGLPGVISLNVGYQRAPLLQQIGTEINEVSLDYNWRFNASIAVDIPLVNIYTRY